jgi:site-specific DNA-adenine methylase
MFAYQGSKRKEIGQIMPHVPTDSTVYIDAFGGSGAVFLAMCDAFAGRITWERATARVIYNELNPRLHSVFLAMANRQSVAVEMGYNASIELFETEPVDYDTLRAVRVRLLDMPPDTNPIDRAVHTLFLIRTGCRGVWNSRRMCHMGRAFPSNHRLYRHLESFAHVQPGDILCQDYRELMRAYQGEAGAFFYLDPPYNSKNTSTVSYVGMGGDQLNYLDFIEQYMKSPNTCCRVMLNIDMTGDVYVRFKDLIRHVYRVQYSSRTALNDPSRPPIYHVICTNYTL